MKFHLLLLRCCFNLFQESGASSQAVPLAVASERLGSNITEPSLSTRDALDKYQIVAQKVAMTCAFSLIFVYSVYLLIDLFAFPKWFNFVSTLLVIVIDVMFWTEKMVRNTRKCLSQTSYEM